MTLLHGDWRSVLTDTQVDAVICDPPYGGRTHDALTSRSDGHITTGLRPDYKAWTPDDVSEFVASWSPRCTGWMACLTSHDLIPAWEAAYADAGRYAFAPVCCLVYGMSVRMLGDGPSSWTLHLMVARPRSRAMMQWGTLPGGYHGPSGRESGGGRGKPDWLMRALVRDYSRPGDLIADPFAGHGATLEAAEGMGRRYVGAEVEFEAFTEAQRRLARPLQVDMFNAKETA